MFTLTSCFRQNISALTNKCLLESYRNDALVHWTLPVYDLDQMLGNKSLKFWCDMQFIISLFLVAVWTKGRNLVFLFCSIIFCNIHRVLLHMKLHNVMEPLLVSSHFPLAFHSAYIYIYIC